MWWPGRSDEISDPGQFVIFQLHSFPQADPDICQVVKSQLFCLFYFRLINTVGQSDVVCYFSQHHCHYQDPGVGVTRGNHSCHVNVIFLKAPGGIRQSCPFMGYGKWLEHHFSVVSFESFLILGLTFVYKLSAEPG